MKQEKKFGLSLIKKRLEKSKPCSKTFSKLFPKKP